MAGKRKVPFDPRAFLVSAGVGRVIFRYNKHQVLYSQGDPADAVFYIQKGKIKLTVVSDQGKEAVVAVLDPDEFLGQGAETGRELGDPGEGLYAAAGLPVGGPGAQDLPLCLNATG